MLAFPIFEEQLPWSSSPCPANIWNDQKGDDMLSLIDRLLGAVVRLLSAISISKPAVQRIPVQNHMSVRRIRR